MVQQFVFSSWEAALKSASLPTAYEQQNNICSYGDICLLSTRELKVFKVKKTDGTATLVIVFKTARYKELWKNWIPTEEQFKTLLELPTLIEEIEKENGEKRK